MSIQEILGCGGGLLLTALTLVEVVPVKLNPWSWIAKKVGRALNGDVLEKVEVLGEEVRDLKEQQRVSDSKTEKRDIDLCRTRILRFSDELRRGIEHSEEFFDQVLDDITRYEHYCEAHKEYENNKAVAAIEKIKRTYKERLDKDDFL